MKKAARGLWSPEEDAKLTACLQQNGMVRWSDVPRLAGLKRCGKSCRLRWVNYLRPNLICGKFTAHEERTIICLHELVGNRWAYIASHFPGRTDNEINNFWNTYMRKKRKQGERLSIHGDGGDGGGGDDDDCAAARAQAQAQAASSMMHVVVLASSVVVPEWSMNRFRDELGINRAQPSCSRSEAPAAVPCQMEYPLFDANSSCHGSALPNPFLLHVHPCGAPIFESQIQAPYSHLPAFGPVETDPFTFNSFHMGPHLLPGWDYII